MKTRRKRWKNPIDPISVGLMFGLGFALKAYANSRSGSGSFLGGAAVKVLRQADPQWSKDTLGNSTTTIGYAGCLLTVLTMIHNFLLSDNITPGEANRIVRNAGGFQGALTIVPTAAQALGLSAPETLRIRGAPSGDPRLTQLVDIALSSGGVAVCHVDHNEGGSFSADQLSSLSGDHFILIFGKRGDTYLAADPAPGTVIELNSKLAGESMWGQTKKYYNTVGAFQVHKA